MANPPRKIQWAIFFLVALLALTVRLPQLGARPMHTDESVNAYLTGKVLAGEAFHYDSRDRHGPALFLLAEPLARLMGAHNFAELTETQLRLTAVIAGFFTVLLFAAGVRMFGFSTSLIAALLFAFCPLPVYYNRYFIHESLFVLSTFGLILSVWRWLATHSFLSATLTGFCAAFMLAGKETAVIHFFAIGVALLICHLCFGAPASDKKISENKQQPVQPKASALPAKSILVMAAVFIFTNVLLFTWFGRNWSVFSDLVKAIPSFTARAGGEGHAQPFWYYGWLLASGWSGTSFLVIAVIGIIRAFRQPSARAGLMLAIYTLLIFVIYSAIPYKTPWLALNFYLPLVILAGMAVEWIWFAIPRLTIRAGVLLVLGTLGFLMAHDIRERVFRHPAAEKNPYAYAHTGEDLLRLPGRLYQLCKQEGWKNPRIAVVAADAWPLPWYLRKFSQVGFWQPGQATGPADVFITSTDISDALAAKLKSFRPEFFGWRPNVLLILWVPDANPQ